MDNTLLVGKSLGFAQAMRIAEGMSYKHDQVIIKARGKQIQRAVEIASMLQTRERATIVNTEIGYNEEIQVSNLNIVLDSMKG